MSGGNTAGAEPAGWLWGGLGIALEAPPGALRHFSAEYGPRRPLAHPSLIIKFGRRVTGPGGSHKGTRWRVALTPSDERPVVAQIEVRGPFGLPLVQSIIVEPLISVVAMDRRIVMLPAAGLETADGTSLVLLGPPASGKTMLSLKALFSGARLFSDDHLFLGEDGQTVGAMRRMRVYGDALEIHGGLRERLRRAEHVRLEALRLIARLSAGYVRLPILVPPARFGRASAGVPFRPETITLLERSSTATALVDRPVPVELTAQVAARLIDDERRPLLEMMGEGWRDRPAASAGPEEALINAAWAGIPARHLTVPRSWSARRTLTELTPRLGLA